MSLKEDHKKNLEIRVQELFNGLMDIGYFDGTIKIAITACYLNVLKEVEKSKEIKARD